jgi:hypothetical protein
MLQAGVGIGQRFSEVAGGPHVGHGICVALGDNVHARIGPVIVAGAVHYVVVDHLDGIVTPAPVLLADQAVHVAVLEVFEFDRERVKDDVSHALVQRGIVPQRHRATFGEKRPHTDKEPALQVGMRQHSLLDDLGSMDDVEHRSFPDYVIRSLAI